jgi:hypothetical protein
MPCVAQAQLVVFRHDVKQSIVKTAVQPPAGDGPE